MDCGGRMVLLPEQCLDLRSKFTSRIVTDHSKKQEWFYYKRSRHSDQIHYSTEETLIKIGQEVD